MRDSTQQDKLKQIINNQPAVFINAQIESEIIDLPTKESAELLRSYGQADSGLAQLVKIAYQMLGLQSFLTAGQKEVRAWTIVAGSNAQEAAGVIHSDFAKGFIAAEIINYHELVKIGSISHAKQLGKVRTEGKQYIMQPDDVVEFRFNV
jgi:ribosome-binding ATPase